MREASTATPFDSSASYWSELDGLRGIAILLVLLRHAAYPVAALPTGDWLHDVMLNGWMGVDLFFVLSGFLVADILFRGRHRSHSLRDYARSRAFRIVPAYLAVLCTCAALGLIGLRDPVSPESALVHIVLMQDYLGSDLLPALWSLGVEAKFYLVAPAIVLLAFGRSRLALGTVLAIASLVAVLGRAHSFAALGDSPSYEAFHFSVRSAAHQCLEPLAAGAAVAVLRVRGGLRLSKSALLGTGAAIVTGHLAWPALLSSPDWYDATLQPAVLAVGFALLVAGAVSPGTPCAVLRYRALVLFARISYSLYLFHMLFVEVALRAAAGLVGNHSGAGVLSLVAAAMLIALAAPVAAAVYYTLERPMIRYGNRTRAEPRTATRDLDRATA